MTQEEKQLLLKELCSRSPHGVKVWRQGGTYVISCIDIEKQKVYLKVDFEATRGWWFDIEEVKLYLRSLSSMTDEEEVDFTFIWEEILSVGKNDDTCVLSVGQIDWLNAHHFDYRGLIEKGLAIEAPADMYKTE